MNKLLTSYAALFGSALIATLRSFQAAGEIHIDNYLLWTLSPYFLLFLLFIIFQRYKFRSSLSITSITTLVFTSLFYFDIVSSSTASLIFFFGPFYLVFIGLIVFGFSANREHNRLHMLHKGDTFQVVGDLPVIYISSWHDKNDRSITTKNEVKGSLLTGNVFTINNDPLVKASAAHIEPQNYFELEKKHISKDKPENLQYDGFYVIAEIDDIKKQCKQIPYHNESAREGH